ncbi:MAG: hypothetical protein MSG64_18650 [Pyrinomonadaceae bacterium MAG19_C2-C3]|nr:hypothetical protein [Pyrinomonadaceae bacterium MAG19_C2-C3]
MRNRFYLPAIMCGVLAGTMTTHAQVSAVVSSPTANNTTANTAANIVERQAAASKLLDEVATELDALRCVENRSMLRATTAGLFWERDDERARTLFRESIADLSAINFDESAPAYGLNNEQQAAMTLRQQLLQMVAQRDALLALELLRSSAGTLSWVAQFNQPPNNYDAQMEMNLAQQIVKDNPQLALKLAEARLEKGLSYEVVSILHQLREKDETAAMKLAKNVMERVRRTDPKVERQAFQTAIHLLQTFAAPNTPDASASQNTSGASSKATLFDARALGEIAEFIAGGLSVGAPHELQQYVPTLTPLIERYAPARLAALKRRAVQAGQHVDSSSRMYNDFNTRLQSNTLDEMMAWTTANAPAEMRGNFYQQIAWKALSTGDAPRARQIANDHITDPAQRRGLLMQIEQQSVQRAISENRFGEARAGIARLGTSDEYLSSLIQLASALKYKKDFETARAVLADAGGFIEVNMSGGRRMSAQLQLAQACAEVDATRGFEIVGSHVVKLNDMLEHAAALDEFQSQQRMFKQGELLINQQYGDGITMLAYNWRQTLQTLARDDFNRAIEVADGAARPELRLATRLLILQTVLQNRNDGQMPRGRVFGSKRRQRISFN